MSNISNEEIYAKIDSLDMSGKMKEKMRLVHECFKKTKFGIPQYEIKGKSSWASWTSWTFNSIGAFFFFIIYYIVKGMWRKAITFLALCFAIIFIIACVDEIFKIGISDYVYQIVGAIPVLIATHSAYYDIYRSKVLEQKFWW